MVPQKITLLSKDLYCGRGRPYNYIEMERAVDTITADYEDNRSGDFVGYEDFAQYMEAEYTLRGYNPNHRCTVGEWEAMGVDGAQEPFAKACVAFLKAELSRFLDSPHVETEWIYSLRNLTEENLGLVRTDAVGLEHLPSLRAINDLILTIAEALNGRDRQKDSQGKFLETELSKAVVITAARIVRLVLDSYPVEELTVPTPV